MGYFYTNTAPESSTVPPAPAVPDAPLPKVQHIMTIVTAMHGKATAQTLVQYIHSLTLAMQLSHDVARRGTPGPPDPDKPCPAWTAMESTIKAASTAFLDAADAAGELAGTTAASVSLLRGIPADMLIRILRAGLEAEADDLLSLLSAVSEPEGGQNHE